jgi:CBS domain containing-hemolysin-like protein
MWCDGFSRKPVVASADKKHTIIGILVAKSLLGIEYGKTLRELFIKGQACINLPTYTSPEKPIVDSMKNFEKDKSNFCIVMNSAAEAAKLQ